MKKIFYILFLVFSLLLISCDPEHNLVFSNKTESDTYIKIKTYSDTTNLYNLKLKRSLEKLDSVITIKPDSIYKIHFGIGTWHTEEIEEFSKLVKEIKIKSKQKTVIYTTAQQIEELFKNNRKASIGKVNINIEIN